MTSGHVTYRIEPDPKGAENGRPRSIGWISAGDGQTHAKVDLRRKRDAEAKAREREKQERGDFRVFHKDIPGNLASFYGIVQCKNNIP